MQVWVHMAVTALRVRIQADPQGHSPLDTRQHPNQGLSSHQRHRGRSDREEAGRLAGRTADKPGDYG